MNPDLKDVEERIPLTTKHSSSSYVLGDTEVQDIARHEAVVLETKTVFMRLMLVCLLQLLLYGSRQIVWVLYARQFTDDGNLIGVVQFIGYFLSAFVVLFMSGFLGPRIGYDYTIFVMSLPLLLGILLECLAQSFWMLAVGLLLAQQRIGFVVYAYNAWILPLVESKVMIVLIQQYLAFAYFLGPVCGGLMSYAFSYRVNYYINFGLSVVLALYIGLLVIGNQKKLEAQQLAMIEIYNRYPLDNGQQPKRISLSNQNSKSDLKSNSNKNLSQVGFLVSNEYRFPSALVQMQKMKRDNVPSVTINATTDAVDSPTSKSKQSASNRSASRELAILVVLLFHYSFVFGAETLVVVWYAVYMNDRFGANTAISCAQIGIVCLCLMITVSQVQRICAQARERYMYSVHTEEIEEKEHSEAPTVKDTKFCGDVFHNRPNEYNLTHLFVVFSGIGYLLFLTCIARFPSSGGWFDAETFNWFGNIFLGLGIGFVFTAMDLLLLDLTPKDKLKAVQSLKAFGGTFASGLLMVFVGAMWEHTINAIWYGFTLCFGLSFSLFVLSLVLLNTP